MTSQQFKIFSDFRDEFCTYCMNLNKKWGNVLRPLQILARLSDNTPDYMVETPVVYNTALDEITEECEIRLIVIGDNPGKDEQREKNKKYLVGQSGKLATGFFENHGEFNTDFRKNVIILNKTPIHTAKTNHLKLIRKNGGEEIRELISESQIFMAEKTAQLHKDLCAAAKDGGISPEIWLVGYSELKENGLFTDYKTEFSENYEKTASEWEKIFVFQHFSMNRFSIDLKNFMTRHREMGIVEATRELGKLHKEEIFGK